MNCGNDLKNTKKMNIEDATIPELEAAIKKKEEELREFIKWNIGKFKDMLDCHWKEIGSFNEVPLFALFCSKQEPIKIILKDLLTEQEFEVESRGKGTELANNIWKKKQKDTEKLTKL